MDLVQATLRQKDLWLLPEQLSAGAEAILGWKTEKHDNILKHNESVAFAPRRHDNTAGSDFPQEEKL